MNAPIVTPFAAAKLATIADTFTAWRIADGNDSAAFPIEVNAATLQDAVNEAAPSCRHKDTLLVLATSGMTGAKVLHTYRIKQGKPTWVRPAGMAHAVQQRPLYAEAQFSLPVAEFAPVEPFRWAPGCDVVGIDRGLVEARS